MGRCLQSELVGRRAAAAAAAAQKEDKLDSSLPHCAGQAVGRTRRDTREGGARVKSRWAVKGRWTVMGTEVQEQAQVLMENLKNRVAELKRSRETTLRSPPGGRCFWYSNNNTVIHLSPTQALKKAGEWTLS